MVGLPLLLAFDDDLDFVFGGEVGAWAGVFVGRLDASLEAEGRREERSERGFLDLPLDLVLQLRSAVVTEFLSS